MPTYEYACTACAERTEVVQRFTDAALTECAACGGTLRKVFSPVGVVFKGSGFYRTDTRAKPTSSTGESAAKPDASTSAPSSGPTPAEPASAPAPAAAQAPSTAPPAKAAS